MLVQLDRVIPKFSREVYAHGFSVVKSIFCHFHANFIPSVKMKTFFPVCGDFLSQLLGILAARG